MRQVLFHTPIGKPEKKHFVSHRSGNRLSKPLRTVRSGLRYAKTVRLKSPLLQAYLRPGKANMGQEKSRIPVIEGTYSPQPIRQGRGGLPVPTAPLWAVPSPRLFRPASRGQLTAHDRHSMGTAASRLKPASWGGHPAHDRYGRGTAGLRPQPASRRRHPAPSRYSRNAAALRSQPASHRGHAGFHRGKGITQNFRRPKAAYNPNGFRRNHGKRQFGGDSPDQTAGGSAQWQHIQKTQ